MKRKCLAIGIILLFVGTITIPSISASSSSNVDFDIYISAGYCREKWGKFGLGWRVVIVNNGDEIIEGVIYVNSTTLSGADILSDCAPFVIAPPVVSIGMGGITLIDCHPVNRILFTVIVEDVVVTKSGYEIGPFVFLILQE
jgi:hypothetical protein